MTNGIQLPKIEGGPIEPGALQTIVMLQVAQRLRRVAEAVEAQSTSNKSTSAELNITDQDFVYHPASPLFGVTIRNDGPGNVYLSVNSPIPEPLQSPLRPNDAFNQNGTRANITAVYFRCLPGATANLRVWGYS